MKKVIIAGAGIIGLTSAWRLAQRGWSVTVFDAREPLSQASWAAAGMLAPGGETEGEGNLAKMLIRSLAMYPEFVRGLEEESGLSVEYRKCGAVEVAFDDSALAELNAKAERQAAIGIASEPCRYREWSARWYPDDAITDPLSLNEALLAVCRARGVTIRELEAVEEVTGNGTGVRTAQGEYGCDRVLIAAGAWSSALVTGVPPSFPVKGHLLYFEMEPGILPGIVRNGHTYLFQREAGGLIAGSSSEHAGFERAVDKTVASEIHDRAAKLLPQLRSLEPADCWNGLRPATEGGPVIGRLGNTEIWTAYGHYRNGILLAPDTAQTIANEFGAG